MTNGARGKYIAGISILAGTSITMFLLVMLNVFPFTPRYIIPIADMMIGSAMTVTGVTMKKLREDLKIQQNLLETTLALGATPRQATFQQVKRSLFIALSPVIDQTKTVELISHPGAMTGLIMGGFFAFGCNPTSDSCHEHANRSIDSKQHTVNLLVLAFLLHKRLSARTYSIQRRITCSSKSISRLTFSKVGYSYMFIFVKITVK